MLKQRIALGKTPCQRPLSAENDRAKTQSYSYNEIRPYRARCRKTPQTVYREGIKAHPGQETSHHTWRIRHDRVDKDGKISLRRAGKMHHLGIGARHRGIPVIILIDEAEITVTDKNTEEVLSQHIIEPEGAYWRNQLTTPGRWPNKKVTPKTRLICHLRRDPLQIVASEGFEPPKAEPADLQSDPFGRLGNSPCAPDRCIHQSGARDSGYRYLCRGKTREP